MPSTTSRAGRRAPRQGTWLRCPTISRQCGVGRAREPRSRRVLRLVRDRVHRKNASFGPLEIFGQLGPTRTADARHSGAGGCARRSRVALTRRVALGAWMAITEMVQNPTMKTLLNAALLLTLLSATTARAQINAGELKAQPDLPFTMTQVATFKLPWRA